MMCARRPEPFISDVREEFRQGRKAIGIQLSFISLGKERGRCAGFGCVHARSLSYACVCARGLGMSGNDRAQS